MKTLSLLLLLFSSIICNAQTPKFKEGITKVNGESFIVEFTDASGRNRIFVRNEKKSKGRDLKPPKTRTFLPFFPPHYTAREFVQIDTGKVIGFIKDVLKKKLNLRITTNRNHTNSSAILAVTISFFTDTKKMSYINYSILQESPIDLNDIATIDKKLWDLNLAPHFVYEDLYKYEYQTSMRLRFYIEK